MARKPIRCEAEFYGNTFYGAGPGNGNIHKVGMLHPVIIIPSELVDDCQHEYAVCDLASHCRECGAYRTRINATRFTKWKKPKITNL